MHVWSFEQGWGSEGDETLINMEEDDSIESCTPRKVLKIFAEANLSCNLRVLGSQLGLSTSHLDEIETLPYRQRMIKILEKIADIQGLSWSLLASALRKPSLKEYATAFAIERYSSTNRSNSMSSSHSESLLRSLSTSTASPDASLTSNVDVQGMSDIIIAIPFKTKRGVTSLITLSSLVTCSIS